MSMSTLPHNNEKNREISEIFRSELTYSKGYTFKTLTNDITTRGFQQELNLMGFGFEFLYSPSSR